MVQVHTLNRGTIPVLAVDYTCDYCDNMILYDGLSDGLFFVSENNMFHTRATRDVCMGFMIFRCNISRRALLLDIYVDSVQRI